MILSLSFSLRSVGFDIGDFKDFSILLHVKISKGYKFKT